MCHSTSPHSWLLKLHKCDIWKAGTGCDVLKFPPMIICAFTAAPSVKYSEAFCTVLAPLDEEKKINGSVVLGILQQPPAHGDPPRHSYFTIRRKNDNPYTLIEQSISVRPAVMSLYRLLQRRSLPVGAFFVVPVVLQGMRNTPKTVR